MDTIPYAAWAKITTEAIELGAEASMVIAMRLAAMASGGAGAEREARLMISEKIQSTLELQAAMMTGRLGSTPLAATQSVLRHYRGKVTANRRRLG